MLTDPAAEEFQYPDDLRLFVQLQLSELVVQIDDGLRLHKKSGSRRRLVVHHPRKETNVFPFDRDHVPAVTHGNYGILQMSLRGSRTYHLLQTGFYEIVLVAYVTSYGSQRRRSVVRHLVFADYRTRNILLELHYRIEQSRDLRNHPEAFRHVVFQEGLYLT